MKRLAFALLFVATPLFAHHGKDFLFVESYEVPHPHTFFGVTSEQYLFRDHEFREELSALTGLSDHLAVEVHAHFVKGSGLQSIAPAVHVHLFDNGALHGAISAEYEIGRRGEGNSPTVRFIVGRAIGDGAVVANLGATRSDEEGTNGIYAIGYRSDLEAPHGWGVEAQGQFHRDAEHEIVGAGYFQLGERVTLKVGAGAIVGLGGPVKVVRTGLVFHL